MSETLYCRVHLRFPYQGKLLTHENARAPEWGGDYKYETQPPLSRTLHSYFLSILEQENIFTNHNRYWDDYFTWIEPIFYGHQEIA